MDKDEMKKKYGPNYIANVIKIIDKRTLLVNVGKNVLSVGDIIQVYELSKPIYDLDGTLLDYYTFCKDELEVIRTEKNYSVCQKKPVIQKIQSPAIALSPLLGVTTERKSYPSLNLKETDIPDLSPNCRYIQIGDPIKLA